jgi:phospholipase C
MLLLQKFWRHRSGFLRNLELSRRKTMTTAGFAQNIKHVFVLMLENRSFDHMLGFSGITGTDAVSGQTTKITGLTGNESNTYDGQPYGVFHPSDWSMPLDPCHEFLCVVKQLSGQASYPQGGPYPSIGCDGFAASYAENGGISNPREIMKCYDSSQLPVLNALAWEFGDNWFSSIPGPTWPNRYFVHAASSAGLDHRPSTVDIAQWFAAGVPLQNGTIFDMRAGNTAKSAKSEIWLTSQSAANWSARQILPISGHTSRVRHGLGRNDG